MVVLPNISPLFVVHVLTLHNLKSRLRLLTLYQSCWETWSNILQKCQILYLAPVISFSSNLGLFSFWQILSLIYFNLKTQWARNGMRKVFDCKYQKSSCAVVIYTLFPKFFFAKYLQVLFQKQNTSLKRREILSWETIELISLGVEIPIASVWGSHSPRTSSIDWLPKC